MHEAYGRADPASERAPDPAGGQPSGPGPSPSIVDPAHLTARSHRPDTCPFFSAEHGGLIGPPVEAPDRANRCVAVGAPQPQSARQQEFVCLTASHVNCPLFHQGVAARRKAAVRAPVARVAPSTAVIVAALTFVAAAAASVGFLLVRGGLTMPVASPSQSAVAVVSQVPASAQAALASPTIAVTAVPPTPSPSPTPSPTPTATPSPTLAPTPSPTAAQTPPRTSARYALLKPCPGTKNCWIYTVRSGDNLRSIANYFGVSYERVLDMNPQITDPTTIRAGDKVRMPPPTR